MEPKDMTPEEVARGRYERELRRIHLLREVAREALSQARIDLDSLDEQERQAGEAYRAALEAAKARP